MLLVPAMILFLVQAPQIRETDLSSLRLIVYGAAPIPVELLKQAMASSRAASSRSTASTETTGAITLLPPEDHDPDDPQKLLSCGYAQTGVELRIVDDDGQGPAAGRGRRDRRALAAGDERLLAPARGHAHVRSAATGSSPAMPATSTTRAISSSTTG